MKAFNGLEIKKALAQVNHCPLAVMWRRFSTPKLRNIAGAKSLLFPLMWPRANTRTFSASSTKRTRGRIKSGRAISACEQKRWESLPNINNETILIWLDQLLEDKNKMFVTELTAEEIKTEIEETKGSMDNFRVWGDRHAIIDCEDYIEVLEEMLEGNYEN